MAKWGKNTSDGGALVSSSLGREVQIYRACCSPRCKCPQHGRFQASPVTSGDAELLQAPHRCWGAPMSSEIAWPCFGWPGLELLTRELSHDHSFGGVSGALMALERINSACPSFSCGHLCSHNGTLAPLLLDSLIVMSILDKFCHGRKNTELNVGAQQFLEVWGCFKPTDFG